jgi:hypothetical protein
MPHIIDEKQKRSLMDRILSSEIFAHSQVYQDLLRYLVEASIKNSPPKEFTIATDVFHKGKDFDPGRDTIVRVYVYNLRKKLDQYYRGDGKNEKIRIEIPKGHYELDFILRHQKKEKRSFSKVWILAAALVLTLINIVFLFMNLQKSETTFLMKSEVWRDFFDSPFQKQVVLGDHFFYVKDSRDRDKRTILRRDDINSNDEFFQYKSQDISRRDYVQLRYPMFPKNSVWPLADIAALFSYCDIDFELEYASNINASDFREKDMIFIGSFHTLGAFAQTFRNSNFTYKVYPNQLAYYDSENDTTVTKLENDDPVYSHVDYGIARKIPGPNGTTLLMFTSFHETGTHGVIKYFTEATTLAELDATLIKEFGYVPNYFEILFRASGYNRTVYTTEIEKIFKVDAGSVFW